MKFPLSRYNLVMKTSGKLSSKKKTIWIKEIRFAFKSVTPFSLDQREIFQSMERTQAHAAPTVF